MSDNDVAGVVVSGTSKLLFSFTGKDNRSIVIRGTEGVVYDLDNTGFNGTSKITWGFDGTQQLMGNTDASLLTIGGWAKASGTFNSLLGGSDFAHYYIGHNFTLDNSGNVVTTYDNTSTSYVAMFTDAGLLNVYEAPATTPGIGAPTFGATPTFSLNMLTGALSLNGQAALISGGALGTPSSGTLTSCTGLPAAGVTGLGSLATLSAAPAGTLTGTTLAAGVTTSSLTSLGTAPAIGAATAISLAIGGATLGSNALAVSGSASLSAAVTTASGGNNLVVTAQATTDVPLTAKGAASQSGDLHQWQSSTAVLLRVTAGGFLACGTSSGNTSVSGSGLGFIGGNPLIQSSNGGGVVILSGDSILLESQNTAQTKLYLKGATSQLIWTSDTSYSTPTSTTGTGDLILTRDAANTLAQRNGANAQASRVYNSYTDAANYERLSLSWQLTSNVGRLAMSAGGSGVVRPIAIDGYPKGSAPAVGDIPSGTFACIFDGTNAWMCYNNAGTLQKVILV